MAGPSYKAQVASLSIQLIQQQALTGELSLQLQEATKARTDLGVRCRLAEARIRELEEELEELKT